MATKKPLKRSTSTRAKAKSSRTNKTTKSKTLKKSNFDSLSWKVLLPVLLIFASIGGYYVYSASANTYTFFHEGNQMWGGTLVRKWGGRPFRSIAAKSGQKAKYSAHYIETNGIGTVVSRNTLLSTDRVCAYIKNNSKFSAEFGLMQKVNGKWRVASGASRANKSSPVYMCSHFSHKQFVKQSSQFAVIAYGSRTVPFEVHEFSGSW